jgi:hypothetical protein
MSAFKPDLSYVIERGTAVDTAPRAPFLLHPKRRLYYSHLIQRLVEIREQSGGPGVFAFASVHPGEGVTLVTRTFSEELVGALNESIAITDPLSLSALDPRPYQLNEVRSVEAHPGISFINMPGVRDVVGSRNQLKENITAFRRRFGWTFIDGSSLSGSSNLLPVAPLIDGIILVAAAGRTRRSDIERAQKLIHMASGKLIGCVLNKRTYPVPDFLYRLL